MKMKATVVAGLLTLLVGGASLLTASEPSSVDTVPLVVNTDWLAEHISDPDLVVVHIGPGGSYEEGHLPGARKGSLRSLIRETEAGIRDEMLAADDIAKAFAELGIGSGTSVVAYFSNEAASWAVARYVLTLEYAGFGGRVAYLDGGLPKWRAEERPVTTDETAIVASNLSITPVTDLIVDTKWLSARLGKPGVAIIDGRPEEEYSGLGGHWDRLGHIPGSKNIPFFTVLAEDPPYLLKTRDEIARMFADAGADPGDTVVVYCGTGLWASQPYLAAKYAGFEARLYDGSFQEWAATEGLPVEATAARETSGE